jgi:hypothetical protein
MTSFGLTACSAVYYQVFHCRFIIHLDLEVRQFLQKPTR